MRHRQLPATRSAPTIAGKVRLDTTETGWRIVLPGVHHTCEADARGHWAKKSSRVAGQHNTLGLVLNALRPEKPGTPCDVYITRISPGKLDRFENLPSSMKALVDAFAKWIGIDDSDERVEYHAKQRQEGPHVYGVEIEAVWEGAKKSA